MKKSRPRVPKIALVSSSGGHFLKTWQLKPWWSQFPHFWVTKKDELTQSYLSRQKTYWGYFPENRHFVHAIKNFFLALSILRKEKPDIIFSTGAGIAPPFFLVAKCLGITTIFMETFILIDHPTLSGKLIYPLSDHFFVQNKQMLKHYPRAQFWGGVL